MIRFALFGLFVASCGGAKSPKAAQPVPPPPPPPPVEQLAPASPEFVLPCAWEPGFEVSYEARLRKTDTRKPQLAGMTSVTPIVVTTLEQGEYTSLFRYHSGVTEIEGLPAETVGVGALLNKLQLPDLNLRMVDGSLTRIENYLELADTLEVALVAAVQDKRAVDQTIAMFRDPEIGPTLALRDIQGLFALHCAAMEPGQVVEVPSQFPNPFGGPPLDGFSRVEVSDYDKEQQLITYETLDAIDSESLAKVLPSVLARFAPDLDVTDEERLTEILKQLPPMQTTIKGKMVYSLEDGFPISVEIHQVIGAEGHPMRRVDMHAWTRVE